MSNANFNGGRGGRTQTKATQATEHTFGGSHKGNPGGKRGDAPVKGSQGTVDKLTKGDTYDLPKGKGC